MFYFFLQLIYVSVHSFIPHTCEKYRTMLSGYNGSCPLWALVSKVLTKSKVLHLELFPSIMLVAFAHTSSVCFIVYLFLKSKVGFTNRISDSLAFFNPTAMGFFLIFTCPVACYVYISTSVTPSLERLLNYLIWSCGQLLSHQPVLFSL